MSILVKTLVCLTLLLKFKRQTVNLGRPCAFVRAMTLLLWMCVQWYVVYETQWWVRRNIVLRCLMGQHALNLATLEMERSLVQKVSEQLPRKWKTYDSFRTICRKPMNRGKSQNKLVSLFRSCNCIINFCIKPGKSILNEGTERNVDVVWQYLCFKIFDGGKYWMSWQIMEYEE